MNGAIAIGLFSTFLVTSCTNIPSSVIDLNEKFLEVKDKGFWFVKFYAPWCAHCKRLLPVWEHVGHTISDLGLPVKVAKLDCTRYTSVASALHIHAYPTLIFFRDGKQIHFEGERKKETLVDFAVKSSSPVVKPLTSLLAFNEAKKNSTKDPSFILLGTNSDLLNAYEKAAEEFFTRTHFYQARDPSFLPEEFKDAGSILVLKDGSHFGFKGSPDSVSGWIASERWPLVARAAPSTLADLATTGKLLVLLVLDSIEMTNSSSSVSVFYTKATEAAKDIRAQFDAASRLQFAWLDGNEVANNIVLDVLVFNYSSYEYYLCPDSAVNATRASLVQWLSGVSRGEATPHGGRGVTQRIKRVIYELWSNVAMMFSSQPLLTSCLFGVPIAFLSIIIYSICSADFSVERDEIYPDDEEESEGELEIEDDHEKAE